MVVVADGLSSNAIEQHAEPFLSLLLPELQTYGYKLSPACLVKYGRVAPLTMLLQNAMLSGCISF
ncbi:MAG: ethanolamine ammonia-lyase light chain EutC [Methylococcaceae bacterium]